MLTEEKMYCDLCNNEITQRGDGRYKVCHTEYNYGGVRTYLEICWDCNKKLSRYIIQKFKEELKEVK